MVFVRIRDINSHLVEYKKQVADKEVKQPLATSMLVLMVTGLFTHLKFSYTQLIPLHGIVRYNDDLPLLTLYTILL